MELKLNIYEKKKVVKTYTAETYDLMFGTVEDLLDIIDIDNIQANNRTELLKTITKIIANSLDVVKPLIKDIFEGLTEEELRNTKLNEIIEIMINVVTYSIQQMTKDNNGKN